MQKNAQNDTKGVRPQWYHFYINITTFANNLKTYPKQ